MVTFQPKDLETRVEMFYQVLQCSSGVTRKELYRNMKRVLGGKVTQIQLSPVWPWLIEFLSRLEIVVTYLMLPACLWTGTMG